MIPYPDFQSEAHLCANPPALAGGSLVSINENGEIVLCEIIDSSITNKNLVYSIWFNKKIAITFLATNNTCYQIEGMPIKAIISGKEFQKYYLSLREKYGDIDLSTVWIIEPQLVREETLGKRRSEEAYKHPIINHLDRLLIK